MDTNKTEQSDLKDNSASTDENNEQESSQAITLDESSSKRIEESKDIEFKFALFEFFNGLFS